VTFDIIVFLTTFALILPAELPDKSFLMTLVLATKQPRFAVWVGASIAFALQATIAVSAGGLLSALPRKPVVGVVMVIFMAGAFFLFRSAWKERQQIGVETEEVEAASTPRTWGSAMLLTLGVIFTAEWGDITQISAAANAAATGNPLSVGLGAWAAEITVAGLGVWLGDRIRGRIHPSRLHAITGIVLTVLSIVAMREFILA
jgi:putative Ca2+/H+ antiporter (TMEM165/GDT1 family)